MSIRTLLNASVGFIFKQLSANFTMKRKSSIAIASSNPFPLQPEQWEINPFRQYIYMLRLFYSFPFWGVVLRHVEEMG